MRRRDALILLGGAVTLPLAAYAQQSERVRRIGILMGYPENDPVARARIEAFRRGLQNLGWTEGRNVQFDFRWPADDPDRIRRDAAEIVTQSPDVIFSSPAQVTLVLKKLTHSIPTVFANVPDPVSLGLVSSLARPGENLTGFANFENELAGKWLGLLKEVAPSSVRIGVLYSPENPAWRGRLRVIEEVAPSLKVQVISAGARDDAEIERALELFTRENAGAVIVLPSVFAVHHRRAIVAGTLKHRLPAIFPFPYFVRDGGLIAYGIDVNDSFRRAAGYVDRILRGEKPADLPVQNPTKFELAINLKTARALGLEIPPMLLARADEVIE